MNTLPEEKVAEEFWVLCELLFFMGMTWVGSCKLLMPLILSLLGEGDNCSFTLSI